MKPLLAEAYLQITPELARCLSAGVADLPDYEYFALCDDVIAQNTLYQTIREKCPAELDILMQQIHTSLNQPPYIALLNGVQIDERALVVLMISLGLGTITRPAGTEQDAEIFNSTEQVNIKPTHTIDWLHTDSTNWVQPNDLTILACIHPDQFGEGQSLILDIDTILEEARADESFYDLVRNAKFPFIVTVDDDVQTMYDFIINENDELRWYRKNIDVAVRIGDGEMTPEQHQAVAKFEELVEKSSAKYLFALDSNDILVINNRKCLHGRTPVKHLSQSNRKLIRTRVRYHS